MRPLLLVVRGRSPVTSAPGVVIERVGRAPLAAAARAVLAAGHERIGVVGDDADAAVVAGAAADLGLRVALAVIPRRRSDINATFAVGGDHLDRLLTGDPYPIDVGFVEGPWGRVHFLGGVAAGLPAGRLGVASLAPLDRGPVTIESRRPLRIEDAVGLLAMNGQHLSGMTVAPRASLLDGVLDIQVLTPTRRHLASLAASMRRGLHLARPDVVRRRMSEAGVEGPPRWRVAADGRHLGRGPFRVSLVPGMVDLLI